MLNRGPDRLRGRKEMDDRQFKAVGERVAVLERDMQHLTLQLTHLDNCLTEAKDETTRQFAEQRQVLQKWDNRWMAIIFLGVGLLVGAGISVAKLFAIGASIAKIAVP